MTITALIKALEAGDQLSGNSKFWAAINDAFPRQGRMVSDVAKAYDGSLDAAMALHEALLPGWKWGGGFGVAMGFAAVCKAGAPPHQAITVENIIPARAWLLAILRAKEAGQ